MGPVADLHVHTTASDGTLRLEAVPDAARQAGLSAVAVTDHDRLHPDLDRPIATLDGVTVIRGIELRVEAAHRLDLLAYGVDPTPALEAELERLQVDRIERGRMIINRVESRLGIDLDIEPRSGLGRPHIARAIAAHSDTDYDVDGAFEHLIGDDGPCYVPRSVPDADRGLRLLDASSPIVAIAHPLRYADSAGWLELASRVDAIERWYPYERPVDPAPIDRAIDANGLLPTGGSDAHGTTIGTVGLDVASYDRFVARLPDP